MSVELLSRIPLFELLDGEALAQISKSTSIVQIEAGQYVFHRGDQGDALYVVESGMLEAVIDEETETERVLSTFFPQDYFGEMSLLTSEPRSASIRAITTSRLIRLSHVEFTRMLEENPQIALHLSKVLSRYVSRTNEELSRSGTRVTTIISLGESSHSYEIGASLLSSLERQYGDPAIILLLGDTGISHVERISLRSIDELERSVQALPSGGHLLHIDRSLLARLDDHAITAILHRLRASYGHILVWLKPASVYERASILTRSDQTYILAHHPAVRHEVDDCYRDISHIVKTVVRIAYVAPVDVVMEHLPNSQRSPVKITLPIAPDQPHPDIDRLARALAGLTVGLALGSGTAQGLSHVGVMKALSEEGIPVDLIAGTSGGALYGSLIASGLTIEEAVRLVLHHTRHNLLDKLDFAFPLRGIIRGKRIERMVRAIIGDVEFPNLPTPLYAIATDLETGEEVVIEEGLVYQAVRASISVPGIFEPYRWNDRILVDGVVVDPLPVSVAREKGADIVIAVQVPAPGKVTMEAGARTRKKNSYSLISSIVRSHHFVGERLADETASEADVLIKPDVARFGWREYVSAAAIIEEGYQAAKAAMPRIASLVRKRGSR